MSGEKILFIDDDPELRELVTFTLEKEMMKVTALEDGSRVLSCLESDDFVLVILDLNLGQKYDGFDLLKQIRKIWATIPVLILSGRKDDYKKIISFELDADDYIEKPFSDFLLVARVKRHIRRHNEISKTMLSPSTESLKFGHLVLDKISGCLYKHGERIDLSAKEYQILKFFMEHPQRLFSLNQIYSQCWNEEYGDENTVRVYINKLRKLIGENSRNPKIIKTVVGMGYRFDPPYK